MNLNTKSKTIILAITPDVKLYECFLINLKALGFTTYLLCNDENFKYRSFKDRGVNFYERTFKKNKNYKQRLQQTYYSNENLLKLEKFPDVEYALVIRPDFFEENVLKKITSKATKSFAYQWDGLDRYPDVKNYIDIFKKFYVFDKKDLFFEKKTYPLTNFYFDCFKSLQKDNPIEYDVYFIGSYDSRIQTLITVCEFLKSKHLKLNIILKGSQKKELKQFDYIHFISEPLTYLENLKMVNKSKMLLDIHNETIHSGLSFRIFETLGFNKKLITTNKIIKNYDFYNPENIYIIQDENINFDTFAKAIYKPNNQNILHKYSFTNWLNYVFEIEEKTDITIE